MGLLELQVRVVECRELSSAFRVYMGGNTLPHPRLFTFAFGAARCLAFLLRLALEEG